MYNRPACQKRSVTGPGELIGYRFALAIGRDPEDTRGRHIIAIDKSTFGDVHRARVIELDAGRITEASHYHFSAETGGYLGGLRIRLRDLGEFLRGLLELLRIPLLSRLHSLHVVGDCLPLLCVIHPLHVFVLRLALFSVIHFLHVFVLRLALFSMIHFLHAFVL